MFLTSRFLPVFFDVMSQVEWMFFMQILTAGGLANMAPVIFKKFMKNATPLDCGKIWNNKRVLGDGKTSRGFLYGILLAGIGIYLLYYITTLFFGWSKLGGPKYYWDFPTASILSLIGLLIGLYFGFFALLGDTIASFVKRRLGIPRGQSWLFFDQTDWAFGLLLGIAILPYFFPWNWYFLMIIPVAFVLHIIIKFVGYKLKIDTKPI